MNINLFIFVSTSTWFLSTSFLLFFNVKLLLTITLFCRYFAISSAVSSELSLYTQMILCNFFEYFFYVCSLSYTCFEIYEIWIFLAKFIYAFFLDRSIRLQINFIAYNKYRYHRNIFRRSFFKKLFFPLKKILKWLKICYIENEYACFCTTVEGSS